MEPSLAELAETFRAAVAVEQSTKAAMERADRERTRAENDYLEANQAVYAARQALLNAAAGDVK
jgi:hypothetical protein